MVSKSLNDIQAGSLCKISVWYLNVEPTAVSLQVNVNVFKEKKRCEVKEDEVIEIIHQKLHSHVSK